MARKNFEFHICGFPLAGPFIILLVFVSVFHPASAAEEPPNVEVSSVAASTSTLNAGSMVKFTVGLVNRGPTSVSNLNLILKDNEREVYSGYVNLESNSSTQYVTVNSDQFNADWDAYECTRHTITASMPESASSVRERSLDLTINGKWFKEVTLFPKEPRVKEDLTVTVLDERGVPHPGAEVKVVNYGSDGEYDRNDEKLPKPTNGEGQAKFRLSKKFNEPYGKYRLDVSALGYCKTTILFEARKGLAISEPDPLNPRLGQLITMKVSDEYNDGLGDVKVTLKGGRRDEVLSPTTPDGLFYFSITDAGNYTLIAEKAGYPVASKTLFITGKITPTVNVNPQGQEVGRNVVISVYADTSPIKDAVVKVIRPDSITEKLPNTPDNGVLNYVPLLAGEYNISVEEGEKYNPASAGFSAYNRFKITVNPAQVKVGDDVRLLAENQLNNPVALAAVAVRGIGRFSEDIRGVTDVNGELKFRLLSAGNYTINLMKEGYLNLSANIMVEDILYIKVSPPQSRFEVGDNVSIKVINNNGDPVKNAVVKILRPDNITVSLPTGEYGLAYNPEIAGVYNISVEGENAVSNNIVLNVKPHPLALNILGDGRKTDGGMGFNVRAESNGRCVGNLTLKLRKPNGGEARFNTDNDGVVFLILNASGNYTLSTDGNSRYAPTNKTIEANIEKENSVISKTTGVSVGLLIIILLALVFAGRSTAKSTTVVEKKTCGLRKL